MSTHDTVPGSNGQGGPPGRLLPPERLDRLSEALATAGGREANPADLPTRQVRRPLPAPQGRSRFLLKYSWWILLVALMALGGAKLLLRSQAHMYKSQATVVVQPASVSAAANLAPDMGTEKGVVASNAVLTIAARTLHQPTGVLFNGLSVVSPGSTYLLNIAYSSPNRYTAQQRAEAIAAAYVAYRTPKASPAGNGKKTVLSTTPTATLITPASLPTSPSSPTPGLDYGVALLLGLSLGIGTAAIRDRLDDRLRGPGDLSARTDLPVLALVPAFWGSKRHAARRLVTIGNPESPVAGAYRDLRTRIVQAVASRGIRTLVVTSPAREDKDAVAANLAVALAQAGWVTALVCADLRGGRIHELFGAGNTEGVTGLVDRPTDLSSALLATTVPGLRVIPAGPPPLDTAAVLQGGAFRAMLDELSRLADFVVVDAPPVLVNADATPVAELAGVIMLVTDADRTTRAQVQAAMEELAPFRKKLIGCVITNVGMRRLPRSLAQVPMADSHAAVTAAGRHHNQEFAAGDEAVTPQGEDGQ